MSDTAQHIEPGTVEEQMRALGHAARAGRGGTRQSHHQDEKRRAGRGRRRDPRLGARHHRRQ